MEVIRLEIEKNGNSESVSFSKCNYSHRKLLEYLEKYEKILIE